jgi:hypothetical protein
MPAFPLKVSANGRYLVDSDGAPFFYHADSAWRMPQRLEREEVSQYLDDRAARGFSAVHVHAINKEREGAANRAGHQPFDPPGDMARPNEPYWDHLDGVLEAIALRGMLAVVSASWLGAGGAGWRPGLTLESARAYGRFLGNRYKHLDNILWVQGGDNDPGDRIDAVRALAAEIGDAAPHQLQTYHAAAEHPSSTFFHGDSWLDIDMAYTYEEAYKQVLAQYARPAPARPVILGETGYEGEANTGFPWSARLVRQQPYWALLSGACGHAYGSATVWHFGEGWAQALDKPALGQMRHVRELFAPKAWHELVPDRTSEMLTAGRGEGPEHVAAARSTDGSLALAYLPTRRTVTVDLGRLCRPVRVSWYDPTSGEYIRVTDTPLHNSGATDLTPPTANSIGDDDFVLVIEADREIAPSAAV